MTETEKLALDRMLYGVSFEADGVRIDPARVRYRDGVFTLDPHPPTADDPGDPVGTEGIARSGLKRDLRHQKRGEAYPASELGPRPQLLDSRPLAPPILSHDTSC